VLSVHELHGLRFVPARGGAQVCGPAEEAAAVRRKPVFESRMFFDNLDEASLSPIVNIVGNDTE
jgi:hypothetical protein